MIFGRQILCQRANRLGGRGVHCGFTLEGRACGSAGRRAGAPGEVAFAGEAEDGATILVDKFRPGGDAHLAEIDAAEADAREEDVDTVAQGLAFEGSYGMGDGLRAVGVSPAKFHFGVSFVDGHFQRCVGHSEGNEFLPVLGTS